MQALYGETGRDTLRAINNLAGTVAAQGDVAGARIALQRVIAITTREYGERDPDCITAMGNLAGILWQDGDWDEAYELQREVVDLHRQVHGNDAQATLMAAAILETMERRAPG